MGPRLYAHTLSCGKIPHFSKAVAIISVQKLDVRVHANFVKNLDKIKLSSGSNVLEARDAHVNALRFFMSLI
jgi:hypothetical protein